MYPPSNGLTQTVNTNANGLSVFTLTDVSGGGYEGQVYIQTQATSQYASVSKTVTVNAGVENDVYITLGATPKAGFDWLLILLIAGIVAAIAVIGGLGYYISKHKPRHHR
jgi:hypothetical protein